MGYLDLSGLSHFLDKIKTVFAAKKDTVLETTLSRGRKANTTIGEGSFAFGDGVEASGAYSHAEGKGTVANGAWAHAEGNGSHASGNRSHAEGTISVAQGLGSHAEGMATTASGTFAHTEGSGATASGNASHAEGSDTTASGVSSHAEGAMSQATGSISHAEGGSLASGDWAHAEGQSSTASGVSSHAEGNGNTASGQMSHAEGINTTASGHRAHAEGESTKASGLDSHVEGLFTTSAGSFSHVSGVFNVADSYNSWPEWEANTPYTAGDKVKVTTTTNNTTTITGYICKTSNSDSSFVSNKWDNVNGKMNYAEIVGNGTYPRTPSNARALDWDGNEYLAGDVYVHAGTDSTGGVKLATVSDIPDMSAKADKTDTVLNTTLSRGRKANTTVGNASVAFGLDAVASNECSVSFGYDNEVTGWAAYAEGCDNKATEDHAHAEGDSNIASGLSSHAEGSANIVTGYAAHVDGQGNISNGRAQHASGLYCVESPLYPEWVAGTSYSVGDRVNRGVYGSYKCITANQDSVWNLSNWKAIWFSGAQAFIIGNGDHDARSNAAVIDWDGTGHFAGDIYVGCNSDSTGGTKLAKITDIPDVDIDDTAGQGDTDKVWSADKQVEELAKKADMQDTVLLTTLSRGRKANSTAGTASVAFGDNVEASGDMSFAIGKDTIAEGNYSVAEGLGGAYETGELDENDEPIAIISSAGYASHTEGMQTFADNKSHAEGYRTQAINTSHAEGYETYAEGGFGSHAEGYQTAAKGGYSSHAEGYETLASGAYGSHAEGKNTTASGGHAHAEGDSTIATSDGAHAEGSNSKATASDAHAEGIYTQASAQAAHAEGYMSVASGMRSHAEGQYTIAAGSYSHTSGMNNVADSYKNWPEWTAGTEYEVGDKVKRTTTSGGTTTVKGYICNTANSDSSFSSSKWTDQNGRMNYAEIIGNGKDQNNRSNARALDWNGNEYLAGDVYVHAGSNSTGGTKLATVSDIADLFNKADKTDTILNTTLSRGRKENTTVGTGSFAFGDNVEASGAQSHAEGGGTTASGNDSHAEGENTSATEWDAHAEGWNTVASGTAAHAEGINTIASGSASHAEGYSSQSAGVYSHAEGSETASNGVNSHAEGQSTIANAQDSHVGGRFNSPDSYSNWPEWVSGASYDVGDKVKVTDATATAQGYICKVANSDTTAPGLNGNKWDFWRTKMNYVEIIGNGSSNNSRSNARALTWTGDERLMGDIYVGCNADSTGGTKLAKITDIPAVATIAETQAIISEYGVSA